MRKKPSYIATIVHMLRYEVDCMTREEILMIIRHLQDKSLEGIPHGYWSTNFTDWVSRGLIIRHEKGVYIGGTKSEEYLKKNTPYPTKGLKKLISPESKTMFYKRYHNNNVSKNDQWEIRVLKNVNSGLKRDKEHYQRMYEQLEGELDELQRENNQLRSGTPKDGDTLSVLRRRVNELENHLKKYENE